MVTPRAGQRTPADLGDDERHPQRRFIGEDAVGELAVLAEAFAVIGGDDDERRPGQAGNAIEERRERVVGPRDLGRVGVAGIPGRKAVGGCIGGMGIEDVHPGEPLRRLRPAPLQR